MKYGCERLKIFRNQFKELGEKDKFWNKFKTAYKELEAKTYKDILNSISENAELLEKMTLEELTELNLKLIHGECLIYKWLTQLLNLQRTISSKHMGFSRLKECQLEEKSLLTLLDYANSNGTDRLVDLIDSKKWLLNFNFDTRELSRLAFKAEQALASDEYRIELAKSVEKLEKAASEIKKNEIRIKFEPRKGMENLEQVVSKAKELVMTLLVNDQVASTVSVAHYQAMIEQFKDMTAKLQTAMSEYHSFQEESTSISPCR